MSSWFTEKVSSFVKDSVPLVSAATTSSAPLSTADELAGTLEQRARALSSPQSAAWLLAKWVEQSASPELQYVFRDKDRKGDLWHMTFFQVLLRSSAFEIVLDTCSRTTTLKAALTDPSADSEADQLRAALKAVAEVVLLPGAIDLWPVLLDALLSDDDAGGPLPWSSWSRRMFASLKRSWRNEALPKNLQNLDRQLTETIMATHADAAKFADAASTRMTMSAAGGQMSKRGIRAALVRRQLPQCASEAAGLRRRTELLCEICERLDATKLQAAVKSKEVERLLADADVACASLEPGMKDLGGKHEEMGKSFSDVGSAQQQQIASILLTQESFAKRRRALGEEKEKLLKRLQDIDSEAVQLEQETQRLGAQVQQLRAQFNLNVDHYQGLMGGSLCAQENLSDRKVRAAAFQECAQAAVKATNAEVSRSSAELAIQMKRRQAELRKASAAYVQKERSRLQLADQCLSAASVGAAAATAAASSAAGASMGDVGEEVAEAVANAQDAWRCAQATLQRVDQIIVGVAEESSQTLPGVAMGRAVDAPGIAGAIGGRIGVEAADASAEAAEFFASEAVAGHRFCADCAVMDAGTSEVAAEDVADWASISHGIYLCMDCAGRHRGLGVHLSFVRSVTMDRWTRPQLQRMRFGGSLQFREFLGRYPELAGVMSSEAPNGVLQRRYTSRAVDYYRRLLAARCEDGSAVCNASAPAETEGHLPALAQQTIPNCNGGGTGGGYRGDEIAESPKASGTTGSLEEERKELEAAYAAHQRQLQDTLAPGAI